MLIINTIKHGDVMQFLSNFTKGLFIGIGAILPGISSGVICMVLGIYEKLLDSILNFFKDIKTNTKFLFSLGLGGSCGAILFSNILVYLFNSIPIPTKSLFIGLLLGSIFVLYRTELETSKKINNKKILSYISFFICFLIGISLIYIENHFSISNEYIQNEYNFLFLVLSGFCMSMGIIIPGVSSTVILMILGVYDTYISAVSIVNMNVIFPIIIGVAMGSIAFMKIIKILLDKFHLQTISGIIGFSLGSIFILYPTYHFDLMSFISIFILVLGFFIGKNIHKKHRSK